LLLNAKRGSLNALEVLLNRSIGLPVRQTEIQLTKEEYTVTLNLWIICLSLFIKKQFLLTLAVVALTSIGYSQTITIGTQVWMTKSLMS